MRYVSINSVPNLSTGTVMRQVTEERRALGDECWCMWGRGRDGEDEYEYNFGSKLGTTIDVIQTRFDGRSGFHSKTATKRLLCKLESIKPDIIHLHNLHGYYINIKMLFDWIVSHKSITVRWTLHDCWAFTGHCAYFTYVNCNQWKEICGKSERCPQLSSYPETLSSSSCRWCYEQKQKCFTQLSSERLTIITPSHWLEELVKKSFLSKYPVEVRYNRIDNSVFKPTKSDFRMRYGIGDRFIILGVASTWTERKGLEVFKKLSLDLDASEYAVVIIGLNKQQIRKLRKTAIALPRLGNATELAEAYSAADVHVQPSIEETFGMTVLEATSCGAPVIVRRGSACAEAARINHNAWVTEVSGSYSQLKREIVNLKQRVG